MNRKQRSIAASQKAQATVPRPFIKSLVPGTAWYWIPVGGIAGVKDAWWPFDALIKLMAGNSWMFPAGWGLTILLHWLTAGVEIESQRKALEAIRGSRRRSPHK